MTTFDKIIRLDSTLAQFSRAQNERRGLRKKIVYFKETYKFAHQHFLNLVIINEKCY